MENKTTQAQLALYFSSWLDFWVKTNKYTQLQAAIRLEVTPGFINMIINKKRAASPRQMEKIAQAINLDLLDILFQGRELLHGKNPGRPSRPIKKADFLSEGLSKKQTKALDAFRGLLMLGGEGVEIITESIQALAGKKNVSGVRRRSG